METTTHNCPICAAEVELPVDLLGSLAAMPGLLTDAIREASPSVGEGWSPGEVAAHLADTEIVAAWRFRQTLSEKEPDIEPFDQDRWAGALRYPERDVRLSLDTFAALRASNVELLQQLDSAGWERMYRHAEYGKLTVRLLAQHKSDHDLAHLRQINGGNVT